MRWPGSVRACLTRYFAAKILAQVAGDTGIVPVEIFAQAKPKEPSNSSVKNFLDLYTSAKAIGTLTKEKHTGKLITEWERLLSETGNKPEQVDISTAVSAFLAVKDEEELVSHRYDCRVSRQLASQKAVQIAATLTSTLLVHHVAPRLETILDKESKISHELVSAQIESRLGGGEGASAKGPDMRIWGKSKELSDVCTSSWLEVDVDGFCRWTGNSQSSVILQSSSLVQLRMGTTFDLQLSHPTTRLLTKAFSSSPLVCDTKVTVQISVGHSWWILPM